MTRTTILLDSAELESLKAIDTSVSRLIRSLVHGYVLSRADSYGKDVAKAKERYDAAIIEYKEAKLAFLGAIVTKIAQDKAKVAELEAMETSIGAGNLQELSEMGEI